MATPSPQDLRSNIANTLALEKAAVKFIDDLISSRAQVGCDNSSIYVIDIFTHLNYLPDTLPELRNYIGRDPSCVSDFVECRGHLWRTQNDVEVRPLPTVFREAIVQLVTYIITKRNNRANLRGALSYLQKYYPTALPFLPPPTNGSSMSSVKDFVVANCPNLFSLINPSDERDWSRTKALGDVEFECTAAAVDGVILLDIAPAWIIELQQQQPESHCSSAAASSISSCGRTAATDSPTTFQSKGIAEVVRVTPAWGYLQSSMYGPIFFTLSACVNQTLIDSGIKLGAQVAFEAKYCEDNAQMFNNVQVKWRAMKVRNLSAEEREGLLEDDLRPVISPPSSEWCDRSSDSLPVPTNELLPQPPPNPVSPLPTCAIVPPTITTPPQPPAIATVVPHVVPQMANSPPPPTAPASSLPHHQETIGEAGTTATTGKTPARSLVEWVKYRQAQRQAAANQQSNNTSLSPPGDQQQLQQGRSSPSPQNAQIPSSSPITSQNSPPRPQQQITSPMPSVQPKNQPTTEEPPVNLQALMQDLEDELGSCVVNEAPQPLPPIYNEYGGGVVENGIHVNNALTGEFGELDDHEAAIMGENNQAILGASSGGSIGASASAITTSGDRQFRDAAVQTDVTDEMLLLRLLRSTPEILDLARIVLNRTT